VPVCPPTTWCSGYAGFRHLLRLQPDIIKLDISLIAGINRNHEQQALTRALLTFAYEVGAQVIAEGIEEPAELNTLQDLGVPWETGLPDRPTRPATKTWVGRGCHRPPASQRDRATALT